MPPVARVEIWNDLACASGTRLAFIPDVVALGSRRRLDGDDQLTLRLRRESAAWAQIREHRVVRVAYTDASFDEWRITGLEEERGKDGLVGVLSCGSPLLDLGRGLIERTEADGSVWPDFELLGLTPSAFLSTIILPAAPSYFAAGTVDPTAVQDLNFKGDTPLSALRQLATLTGAELRVRRNGTTSYFVDLVTAIGGSAVAVSLRVAKNVTAIQRRTRTEKQATRIYGLGAGEETSRLTIGGARWKITTIIGTDITLADPAGGDGPLAFDDQLNGFYLREIGAGASTLINDSVASTQKVTVASAAGLAVDDIVRIERNSGGDDLTYLEDVASKATYGMTVGTIERQDIPATRNLVTNPQLNGTYTSGLPSNWSKVGTPTTAEETGALYSRYGGKSCKITATAEGQGIQSAAITIAPTTSKPNFSWFAAVQLVSGKVRIELVDLTNSKTYPDGTTGKAWTNELKVWKELGMEAGLDAQAVACTSVKLRILADGGAATFYVDAAQLTQEASQEPFYAGAGANTLWQAVNDALLEHGVPSVNVTVDLLDLQRFDAALFPYEELVLGGTVKLVDQDLWAAPITTRIIQIDRDELAEMSTQVQLANDRASLIDALVRPTRRRRRASDADAAAEPTVQAHFDPVADSPGYVRVTLSARPAGTTIYYLVDDAGTAVPVIGASSWGLYGASFIVSQLETTNRQLAAYCQLGSRFGRVQQWLIDKDTVPSATATITEPTGGTAHVAWVPDDDVAMVRLYRKKNGTGNGWPTTNNNSTGVLDEVQLIGEISVEADGGARDRVGSPLTGMTGGTGIGGTAWEETGYVNTDVIKVILIPVDRFGNVGARVTASRTMAGAASPTLTSFSVAKLTDGSSCGSPASWRGTWATANATDGVHKIVMICDAPSGLTVGTQTNPVSVTTMDDTGPGYWHSYAKGSGPITVTYRAELRLIADNSLLDQLSDDDADNGFTCG